MAKKKLAPRCVFLSHSSKDAAALKKLVKCFAATKSTSGTARNTSGALLSGTMKLATPSKSAIG